MKNLTDLEILSDEYDLFWMLSDSEKIEFLFDALSIGVSESILKQICKPKPSSGLNVKSSSSEDMSVGPHRLCISVFDDILTLNSDNLRVIRIFVRKFFRDGYILVRTNEIKKDKDYDIYRYFKAYNIYKTGLPICEN
jgi:hypothetical protein